MTFARRRRCIGGWARACLPWWTMPGRATPTGDAWWAYVQDGFNTLLQECGFDCRTAARAVAALRPKLRDPSRHRLYPDAVPVLAELQRRGYRSFLLSNNFPELWKVAQKLGLAPYFSGHIVSGEVGWDKPAREIFEAARQLAGAAAERRHDRGQRRRRHRGGQKRGFAGGFGPQRAGRAADACCPQLTGLLELLP